jgi:hypothetical protein
LLIIINFINIFLLYYSLYLIIGNLKYGWFYFNLVFYFTILLIVNLLIRSLAYIFILGVNLVLLFYITFSLWFCSFYGSLVILNRFYYMLSIFIVILFIFDLFVTFLRPVTLTLRIFINIILGHTLLLIIRLSIRIYLIFISIFELFVYLIQSYVFMTLCKSYIDIFNYRPSLWLEHLPYDEKVSAC